MAVPTTTELRKRALSRIAERIDPAKSRFKPLTVLRAEAKRLVDQYFEVECPALPKPERDKWTDDVLAEAPGVWPLEELCRDDTVQEILVLAAGQVIARRGEQWFPTSSRFRDAEQYRAVLIRLHDAESIVTGIPGTLVGGFDVKLGNGFRALAIVPPGVMDQPPLLLLARSAIPSSGPPSSQGSVVTNVATVAPPMPQSPPPPPPVVPVNGPRSGIIDLSLPPSAGGSSVGRSAQHVDPFIRFRQRVTERILNRLASARVYDLNLLPAAELRKIVMAHVTEFAAEERLVLDPSTIERVSVEILASMNRGN